MHHHNNTFYTKLNTLLLRILITETRKTAAVFVGSTLISDVTWTGSGSMSPVVTMPTTAPGPALT